MAAVISELTVFGQYSGCKPNIDKTICIPLGAAKADNRLTDELKERYGRDFISDSFTALGITFNNHSSINEICNLNYNSKIAKAQSRIKSWSKRDLSLIGKCTIIKSLIMAQFTYLIIPLPTPSETIIKTIDTLIFHFLWGCKRDKIKRVVVTRAREYGGLGLFSTHDFILSLKVSLLNKVLDTSFQHNWKDIVINQLKFPDHVKISIENGTGIYH